MEGFTPSERNERLQRERNTPKGVFQIDCEYRVSAKKETLNQGIAGKVVRIRKFLDDNECWAQINNDVYKISLFHLNPKTLKGRYRVNYNDIITSELFKDLEFEYGYERISDLNTKLSEIEATCKLDPELVEPFIKLSFIKRIEHSVVQFRESKVTLYLGVVAYLDYEGQKILAIAPGREISGIVNRFEQLSGKNVWNILKTISYLELPLCTCGGNHQITLESPSFAAVQLRCEDCKKILYYCIKTLVENPEISLQKMFQENAYRSN